VLSRGISRRYRGYGRSLVWHSSFTNVQDFRLIVFIISSLFEPPFHHISSLAASPVAWFTAGFPIFSNADARQTSQEAMYAESSNFRIIQAQIQSTGVARQIHRNGRGPRCLELVGELISFGEATLAPISHCMHHRLKCNIDTVVSVQVSRNLSRYREGKKN
jgi:hypothetical protein